MLFVLSANVSNNLRRFHRSTESGHTAASKLYSDAEIRVSHVFRIKRPCFCRVCVWNICTDVKLRLCCSVFHHFMHRDFYSRGIRDVWPGLIQRSSSHSSGYDWGTPQSRTCFWQVELLTSGPVHGCTVFAIWFSADGLQWIEQGRRKPFCHFMFAWSPTPSSPTNLRYLFQDRRRHIADGTISGFIYTWWCLFWTWRTLGNASFIHNRHRFFDVSFLICMFQDSVPAGSYNDPFLSSVCVCMCARCVCVCVCVGVGVGVGVGVCVCACAYACFFDRRRR